MTILNQSKNSDKRIDVETGEYLAGAPDGAEARADVFAEHDAGAPEASPLSGNTGVHGSLAQAAVSIDTLTAVLHHVTIEQVAGLLRANGFDTLTKREFGSRWCEEFYDGAHGLRVEIVPRDKSQDYATISLMGEGCQWLGSAGVRKLLHDVVLLCTSNGSKFNVPRFDVATDTQQFPAAWFETALRSGAIERRSQKHRVYSSDGDGLTVYLGSPTSDKQWRVYHKTDGSTFGEGVAFTRVEQQFRGKVAHETALMYMAFDLEDWGRITAALLNGYATVNKRWWRAFVGSVEKAAVVVRRVRSTVEKTKAWLERQVAPALALVVDAMSHAVNGSGRAFIEVLLMDGRERRKPLQEVMVRENVASGLPTIAVYHIT